MIDLRPIIAEAKTLEVEGDCGRAATAFLADWHDAGANPHGYVPHGETVILAEAGRSCAKARIVQTRRGHWLTGHDFSNATGSTSGGPSVWSREAYESQAEAVRAVAASASRWFAAEIASRSSCVSDKTRAEAARIVETLRAVIDPPRPAMAQLDLFGAAL